MTTGRIPPLGEAEAVARGAEVRIHPNLARLEVYRVLLHHPPLAKSVSNLLVMLLYKGRLLDERLRELAIMRLGWATAAVYEWTQHWRIARDLGMSEAEIVGVRDWRHSAVYGEAEQAVLAAVDETLATGALSAETARRCLAAVGGVPQLLELVAAIGNWRLFSQLLRTLKIPLEAGMEPWPPDGLVPPAPCFGVRGGAFGHEGVDEPPRIPPLSPDEAAAVARANGIDEARGRRGPYRTLLQHPRLALAADGLLQRLLDQGVLAPRVRELIIMRIAWATGSAVEWARHWPYCQRLGIPPEVVVGLRDWQSADVFLPAERAALAATDETLATGTVSDGNWAELEPHFPAIPEQLEIVLAIGNWRMYSQLLRSAGVPLEPTDAVWAPDGVGPD